MMALVILAVQLIAAFIVEAEALNKIERADPRTLSVRSRAGWVAILKVAGWVVLAIGAGGALMTPLVPGAQAPDWWNVCTLAGFAVLIVRTRLREVPPGVSRPESDDFGRPTVINAADIERALDRQVQRTNAIVTPVVDSAADVAADVRERISP